MLRSDLPTRAQSGFTLIEVLVAIVVLSIGLLGLAGLQATGLRHNQSAGFRSTATVLAYDIADAMRANRVEARNNNYTILMSAAKPTGTAVYQIDLNNWLSEIALRLPAGDGAVSVVNDVVTVTVQWDDSRGALAVQQFVMASQL
jgi:type IV pilus assembly protein PilV